MGGEPTFVSIDDHDGAEWNTAALGPRKYKLRRRRSLRRLRDRFAPGGFLHYGQGKWYPGEPLPRWAFGLLLAEGRRADLARPGPRRRRDASHGITATDDDAKRVRHARWPSGSGVDPKYAMPGLRGRLVLPVEGTAAAGQRRPVRQQARRTRRTASGSPRSSSRGSDKVVGYALPLRRALQPTAPAAWVSGAVVLPARAAVPRPRRLADGLPAAARLAPVGGQSDYPFVHEQTRGPREPAARRDGSRRSGRSPVPRAANPVGYVEQMLDAGDADRDADVGRRGDGSATDGVGTAAAATPTAPLDRRRRRGADAAARRRPVRTGSSAPPCASSRADGMLHVFMPPLRYLEDYLELVAAVEDTAAELQTAGADRRATRRRTTRG